MEKKRKQNMHYGQEKRKTNLQHKDQAKSMTESLCSEPKAHSYVLSSNWAMKKAELRIVKKREHEK